MIIEKYSCVVYYKEEDSDIVYAEFPNSLKVDLEMARELVANRLDFTKNEMHYFVLDVSNVKEISPEAKEFMQKPETGLKNILGGALIATNPVATLIANIFIKTRKDFQARVFSSKESALSWIKDQKQQKLITS
jgi:hypothetical protein